MNSTDNACAILYKSFHVIFYLYKSSHVYLLLAHLFTCSVALRHLHLAVMDPTHNSSPIFSQEGKALRQKKKKKRAPISCICLFSAGGT